MFLDIVIYANNFETKEKWKSTEEKNELVQIQLQCIG